MRRNTPPRWQKATPGAALQAVARKDPEKAVTAKADVMQWLRTSQDVVKRSYQTAERQKPVQFFGKDASVDGVFLRLLLHNNEHMGQSIAYARMNGIVPPWSQ